MARDYTKFTVNISKRHKPAARIAIAKEIIDHVINRTQGGVDKDGKKFKSGYSKSYAESIEGKAGGKRQGGRPNLTLTSEMLESLRLLSQKKGKLVIGYNKRSDKEILGKVEGNVRGTYGQKSPIPGKQRDFMGVEKKAVKRIEKQYPTAKADREELLKRLVELELAEKKAATVVGGQIIFEDELGDET